jgi:hypothetical protein
MSRDTPFLTCLAQIIRYSERTAVFWLFKDKIKYSIPIHCSEKGELGPLIKVVRKEREIEIYFERVLPEEELGERRIEPRELK